MTRSNTTSSRARLEETTARFNALMTQQKAEHHRVYRKALEDKQTELLSLLETINGVQADVEAHRSELAAQGE